MPSEPESTTPSFVIGGSPPSRRPGRRPLVTIGTLVVLVAAALAVLFTRGGSGGGPNVALALSFTKGDVYNFQATVHLNATISAQGRSLPVNATASGPESMRVIRTSPSGMATLVLKVGPFTANAGGRQQTTPAQSITLKIAPDGKVSGGGLLGGITQSLGGGATLPGTNQFAPLLPDHKVSPGDSWNTSVHRSLSAIGSGRLAFTAHSTYERNELIHGVDAAVIQTRMHMPLDVSIDLGKVASGFGSASTPGLPQLGSGTIRYSGSADVSVTSWLDLARRHLEKMTEDANLDVGFSLVGGSVPNNPGEIGMKGSMTLTLERVR